VNTVHKLYGTLLCLGNDHIPNHPVVAQMYLMKLPEQQDMPGRGLTMTEKWMKWKDWQRWKGRGMTYKGFSDSKNCV
jgi:hypothetical protein